MARIYKQFAKYRTNARGSLAIPFAICMTVILLAVAIAIDMRSLVNVKTKSQDFTDSATLAASKYMSDNLQEAQTLLGSKTHKREARKIAKNILRASLNSADYQIEKTKFKFTDEFVRLDVEVHKQTVLMDIFGRKNMPIHVSSTVALPRLQPQDIDIVLMTDVTGSMVEELEAVQNNLRNLPSDLATELSNSGITVGTTRVKFIFFRDYIIDSVTGSTNRLGPPPNARDGAMFESPFYDLPRQDLSAEQYINQFEAAAGGDAPESALEALTHAVDASGWRDDNTTVKVVLLWTDSANSPLHEWDRPEQIASFDHWSWYYDEEWAKRINPEFVDLDLPGRAQYMYDNFYPAAEIPNTLNQLRTKIEGFHDKNSDGKSQAVSVKINLSDTCLSSDGMASCGDWDEVNGWRGVEVNKVDKTMSSDQNYQKIIFDISEAVKTQAKIGQLRITN